jgi:hypothetical protein
LPRGMSRSSLAAWASVAPKSGFSGLGLLGSFVYGGAEREAAL